MLKFFISCRVLLRDSFVVQFSVKFLRKTAPTIFILLFIFMTAVYGVAESRSRDSQLDYKTIGNQKLFDDVVINSPRDYENIELVFENMMNYYQNISSVSEDMPGFMISAIHAFKILAYIELAYIYTGTSSVTVSFPQSSASLSAEGDIEDPEIICMSTSGEPQASTGGAGFWDRLVQLVKEIRENWELEIDQDNSSLFLGYSLGSWRGPGGSSGSWVKTTTPFLPARPLEGGVTILSLYSDDSSCFSRSGFGLGGAFVDYGGGMGSGLLLGVSWSF